MSPIKHTFLLLITIGLLANNVIGQKQIDSQELLWSRYNLKLKVNENYQVIQELEERTYCFPWRQHQFVSRTHLERKLGNGWSSGIAFTYFRQALPHDPEISNYTINEELRPQVELEYKQVLSKKITFSHRYWSEFRFFEQPDGSYDYSNNRTRYKLELRYSPTSTITLKTFDEIFINIGGQIVQNVFDQNRYGGSIQYMPQSNFGVEVGYFNWFQQRKSGVDFYNRNIVRLTIHHTINFKQSKSL